MIVPARVRCGEAVMIRMADDAVRFPEDVVMCHPVRFASGHCPMIPRS